MFLMIYLLVGAVYAKLEIAKARENKNMHSNSYVVFLTIACLTLWPAMVLGITLKWLAEYDK